jgi:hypothetical protein
VGVNGVECLRRAAGECVEAGGPPLVCVSLQKAAEAGDTFCIYARLRLAMEAAVQEAYYKLLGVEPGEAERRIAVRSRYYASFTASMVKQLRGVHGSRRRWLLKVYLRLGEWLHPTAKLHKARGTPPLDDSLLLEALDAIGYTLLIAGYSTPSRSLAEACGLEKSFRLHERRSLGEG